ncbi:MAG: MOSC domain-containing protein [Candidatus Limnocylindrales bacterium]
MSTSTLEAIFVAETSGAPMRRVDSARAVAGRGIKGDRYFLGARQSPERRRHGGDLTLIAGEVLDEVQDLGMRFDAGLSRRNLVVRGMDLDRLIGRRFRVGDVVLEGIETCEPCLELTKACDDPGVLRALVHRSGLRAVVRIGGELRIGNQLAVEPRIAEPPAVSARCRHR